MTNISDDVRKLIDAYPDGIRDGRAYTKLIVDLASMGCIIAEPMKSVVIPPDHVVFVTAIPTEPYHTEMRSVKQRDGSYKKEQQNISPHWEEFSAKRVASSMKAALIGQIASNSGMTSVYDGAVPNAEPDAIEWRIEYARMDLAGRVVNMSANRINAIGKDAGSKAQSTARKRVVTAMLGLPSQFEHKHVGATVICARLEFRPVMGQDPEFDRKYREAAMVKAMGLQNALYGTPAPAAAIAAPPAQESPQDAEQLPDDEPPAPTTTQTRTEQIQPMDSSGNTAPDPTSQDQAELRKRMMAAISQARDNGKTNDDIIAAQQTSGLNKDNLTPDALSLFEAELSGCPF